MTLLRHQGFYTDKMDNEHKFEVGHNMNQVQQTLVIQSKLLINYESIIMIQ